ncbi:MAG: FxsA family protein [Rhodothermales bacterium]|nr:FxsA family protein [Rhodothermales bacterium]
MRTNLWIILLFVATPIVEMALLVRLGSILGFWPTILIVVLTGVMGGSLARRQGLATWLRFNKSLSSGRLPSDEIFDGVIILISAVLLLTPGVITDLVGFLGLIPPTRHWLRRRIGARLRRTSSDTAWSSLFGASTQSTPEQEDPANDDGWSGQAAPKPRHSRTGGSVQN